MKIVYIYDSLAKYGGIERILIDRMNYLAERLGYQVYVITASQGNHTVKFPLSPKVKHIDLNLTMHDVYRYRLPLRLWKAYRKKKTFRHNLRETINTISPDIISSPTIFMPDVISNLNTNAKIVLESHGAKSMAFYGDVDITNPIKKWMKKRQSERAFDIAEKSCDALVTLTVTDAREWTHAKKIEVIPNFTNIVSMQTPNGSNSVIAAGRLTYQKGFDFLIDAWKQVSKNYPLWHLNIYGEGIGKESLQKQIENNGLVNKITIHPATKNILEAMLSNSFFVFPSRYEGFGLVLIEAMTCGLPCVSFDCPYGPSDIIKGKEDGLLVENGNVEALADAICWMIEHEDERKEMGRRAKENVKRFSPDVVMAQWDILYKELVNEKK